MKPPDGPIRLRTRIYRTRLPKNLNRILGAGLLALLMVWGGGVPAGASDIVVIERTCSSKKGGLTLALANIHNRVSDSSAGIQRGESIEENKTRILTLVDMAKKKGANMVLFPEFSLTGYFWPDPQWGRTQDKAPKSPVNLKGEERKRDPHGEILSAYNPQGDAHCWAYMNQGALDHHKDWLKQLKDRLDDRLQYIIFNALRKNPAHPSLAADRKSVV